jgi:parallel beta-helix repeat protein
LQFLQNFWKQITNTNFGIIAHGSDNDITTNLVELIKFSGIKLVFATSNFIQENEVSSSDAGIEVSQSSHNNIISENNVVSNIHQGIMLSHSDGNTVFGNKITNCGIGASIYVANNNNFFYNNFVDNKEHFSANELYAMTFGYGGSKNTYNENFWSDYISKYPNAKEVDASGIGNTPYVINENNTDYYPLMRKVDFSAPLPTPVGLEDEFTLPTIAAIITVSAVFAGAGLLFYYKKINRKAKTV